ncbi:MAG: hypothetical protein RR428_06930 [Coprobacillus sp.]
MSKFIVEFIVNMSIPQIICISLSFICSLFKNTAISIIQMILFIFFTSSWSESIIWESQPSFPIDQLFSFVKRPFEIFYQNNEWGIDTMYGLQNEIGRKYLLLFWLLLLLSLFVIYLYRQNMKKRFYLKASIVVLNLVLVMSLIGGVLPESRLRINNKWDGYFSDFFSYNRQGLKKTNDVNYEITDYNLNVKIERLLNVKGELQLKSQIPQQDFSFTLYKNYKIRSLNSKDSLTYNQEGDYVHIHFDKPIIDAQLSIEYSGYHPRFYSNQEAVLLPGYFPWYPMSGEKQIYINSGDIMQPVLNGYNSYNSINKANITLHTDRDIITNLKKTNKKEYSGKSDSISLFDGYIDNTGYDDIITYLSLANGKEDEVSFMRTEIKNSLEILDQQIGISTNLFDSKKIFFVTQDIHRNNSLGAIAIFDDYAIITRMINPGSLLEYLTNKSSKYTPLACLMKTLSFGNTVEETYSNTLNNLDNQELKSKIEEVVKKVGIKKFLNATYLYTLDESQEDDMQFLERMMKND